MIFQVYVATAALKVTMSAASLLDVTVSYDKFLEREEARPGSAPIWGGKKGEFRDWTMIN